MGENHGAGAGARRNDSGSSRSVSVSDSASASASVSVRSVKSVCWWGLVWRHLRSVQRTGSSPVALSVVGRDGVHHSVQLGQQEVEELAARSATGVILLEPSLGPAGTAGTGGFAHLNHASKAAALAEENRQLRGALQRSRSQPSASAVLRRFRPSTCVHCGVVCLGCAPANNSS